MQQKQPRTRQIPPIQRAIQIPPPPARRLTPVETGIIMKRARKLGRHGILTPYDHRLLDALLFQCGNPLSGAVVVSYTALARITGMCRATITKGVKRLTESGLLQRIKRRLRMTWHQGGTASLQAPNAYLFNVPHTPNTEAASQPVNQMLDILYISQEVNADVTAARAALAKINERNQRRNHEVNQERIARAKQEGRFVAV